MRIPALCFTLFVLGISGQSDNVENCKTVLTNGRTMACDMSSAKTVCQNCVQQIGDGQSNAGIDQCKDSVPLIAPCFDFVRYTKTWSVNNMQSWGFTVSKLVGGREGPCNYLSKQQKNIPNLVRMASTKMNQARDTLRSDPNIKKLWTVGLKVAAMGKDIILGSEDQMRPALTRVAEVTTEVLTKNGAPPEVQENSTGCIVYLVDLFLEGVRAFDLEALRKKAPF